MHIVVIAWIYVVGMASIVEATAPGGTVLGALLTFVFWGVLPLGVVLYLLGTPARKKALRRAEAAAVEEVAVDVATAQGGPASALAAGAPAAGLQPDRGGHAAGGAGRLAAPVAPEREEP